MEHQPGNTVRCAARIVSQSQTGLGAVAAGQRIALHVTNWGKVKNQNAKYYSSFLPSSPFSFPIFLPP